MSQDPGPGAKFMKRFSQTLIVATLLLCLTITSCQVDRTTLEPVPNLNGPLPSFIFDLLVPGPHEVVSLEAFRSGYHYPTESHPAPNNAKSSICADIYPGPLLEPGDQDYPASRVTVYLDGKQAAMSEQLFRVVNEIQLYDEDGKVIATASGPLVICWMVEVSPGEHIATIRAEKTSGDSIDYSWSFEITE